MDKVKSKDKADLREDLVFSKAQFLKQRRDQFLFVNSLNMDDDIRFHLVNLRLLFARRAAIDAAIGTVLVELEHIEEERVALSQLVLDTAREGNLQLLQRQNIHIYVLNERYQQVERNGKSHVIEKFDAIFKPRIAVARFVEVGNVDDATYLVNLRAVEGWRGYACIDDDFVPEEERLQIAQTLQQGLVRLRHFQRDAMGNPVPEFFN